MIFKHSTVVLQPNHIVKSFKYGIPDRNQLQGRTDDSPQKRMLKQLYLSMVVMGLLITLQTILRGKETTLYSHHSCNPL